jgi:hypothetical protein
MIEVKSHTALVEAVNDVVGADRLVVGLDRSPVRKVRGMLTPKSHVAAFEATSIEMKRPHKFLFDVDDQGAFPLGSEVSFEEEPHRRFIVVSPERLHTVVDRAAHCSVWLDEVMVTAVETDGGGSQGSGS